MKDLKPPGLRQLALPELLEIIWDGEANEHYDSAELVLANDPNPNFANTHLEDSHLRVGTAQKVLASRAKYFDSRISVESALEWAGSNSAFRNTLIDGGRIGSLDLSGGTFNSVRIDGLKIGYGNFINGTINDVLFSNCTFDTLDLFGCKAKRVAFENCSVEELDVRTATLEDFDLRGLAFSQVNGLQSLYGGTINELQLMQLAPLLANNLGLVVLD